MVPNVSFRRGFFTTRVAAIGRRLPVGLIAGVNLLPAR